MRRNLIAALSTRAAPVATQDTFGLPDRQAAKTQATVDCCMEQPSWLKRLATHERALYEAIPPRCACQTDSQQNAARESPVFGGKFQLAGRVRNGYWERGQ